MKLKWLVYSILLVPILISFGLVHKDTYNILIWWASILIIGLIFLPLTYKIFNRFFDKGYMFSKTIGLALLSFALWLLSSMKLLPFNIFSISILALVATIVIYMKFKGFTLFKEIMKDFKVQRAFVLEEALFLLCIVLFAYVRGHAPSYGVEMRMDFAFLNDLLNTKYMPPVDMWLANAPANYYYYGHYVFAFLTKIGRIDSAITYNLALSTIFAFGFTLTFSLTANLVHLLGKLKMHNIILAGLISACLLSLGGNLHTILYADIIPAAQNAGVYHNQLGEVKNDYFFADARSYIGTTPPTKDHTITEFPSYSYILGDLHAQIMDVAFVITFMALLLAFLINTSKKKLKVADKLTAKKSEKNKIIANIKDIVSRIPLEMWLLILMLPVLWLTNAWDYPIYITTAAAVILYINLKHFNFKLEAIKHSIFDLLKLILISLILLIPFFIYFINPTGGVKVTNLAHLFSPLYLFQLFIVWGYQVLLAILFIIFVIRAYPNAENISYPKINLKLQKKAAVNKHQSPKSFLSKSYRLLLYFINEVIKLPTRVFKKVCQLISDLSPSDIFVLVISCCAMGLILVSEVVYQKDVSGNDYYRANTVWKVGLQAFVMFDIIAGYIIIRLTAIKRYKITKLLTGLGFTAIFITVMLFSWYGLGQPYLDLSLQKPVTKTGLQFPIKKTGKYIDLDVNTNFKNSQPDDYKTIQWFKKNVTGQPVILEANGDSYTDYGRFSIALGFPTIINWYGHHQYWLGPDYLTKLSDRVNEVSTVYTSDDVMLTEKILKKYKVQYIIIGNLERQKKEFMTQVNGQDVSNIKEGKLLGMGHVVFEAGSTKVIQVDKSVLE